MPFICWFVPALALAVPDDVVLSRARDAIGASGVQTRLPRSDEATGGTEVVDTTPRHVVIIPDAVTAIAHVVTWSLIIAGLAWAAIVVVRRATSYARDVSEPRAATPSTPPPRRAPEPEMLAASGRYRDAIRGLLQRSLAAVCDGGRAPDSATSRELLAALSLDETAKGALGDLVRCAERHIYAGIPAGPGDYARCFARWRTLRGRLR